MEPQKQYCEWPEFPPAAWRDTYATLHMWTQIVGKSLRSAPAPADMLLRFYLSAYEAAADPGTWERASLERPVAD